MELDGDTQLELEAPTTVDDDVRQLTNDQLMDLLFEGSDAETDDVTAFLREIARRREQDRDFMIDVSYNTPRRTIVESFRNTPSRSPWYDHALRQAMLADTPHWENMVVSPMSAVKRQRMHIRSITEVADGLGLPGQRYLSVFQVLAYLEIVGERSATARELIHLFLTTERDRSHFAFLNGFAENGADDLRSAVIAPGTVIEQDRCDQGMLIPCIGAITHAEDRHEVFFEAFELNQTLSPEVFVATVVND